MPELGADGYFDGVPPTVGVSDVVVAPPHTDEVPSAIVQVPEKVPTLLAGNDEQLLHVLNVSIDALNAAGGPCTNGGETYDVMPSPATAETLRGAAPSMTVSPTTEHAATSKKRLAEKSARGERTFTEAPFKKKKNLISIHVTVR